MGSRKNRTGTFLSDLTHCLFRISSGSRIVLVTSVMAEGEHAPCPSPNPLCCPHGASTGAHFMTIMTRMRDSPCSVCSLDPFLCLLKTPQRSDSTERT